MNTKIQNYDIIYDKVHNFFIKVRFTLSPQTNFDKKSVQLLSTSLSSLVYTCKYNSDCHGNGYCKREFHQALMKTVGVCKCLSNYNYALDCSIYGCKYNLKASFTYNI